MKVWLSFIVLSISTFLLKGQTFNDALFFGQDNLNGNARYVSMGGAFGALGGNSSAVTKNAAGIGVYRKGELSLSYQISNQGYNTVHYENSINSTKTEGQVPNVNVVFSNKIEESDWKNYNLMFSYNRRNNFDFSYSAKGINQESSKLDLYLRDIIEADIYVDEIYDYFPFGAALAWDVLLIDTANGDYFHALENYGHYQEYTANVSGGVNDFYIGMGTNYNDKLYLGATIGITSINYNKKSTYSETPLEGNSLTYLESWEEEERIEISGRGLNLRLGIIYWFNEKTRMGIGFNSGTSYTLSESYEKNILANWTDIENTTSKSPIGFNQYEFISPYSIVFSVARVDKYIGSLDFDLELITYGRMRYGNVAGYPIDFKVPNTKFDENAAVSMNMSLGGELLLGPVILRGGARIMGNPEKGKEFFNRYALSGGLGYRIKRTSFDLAYSFFDSEPTNTNLHYAYNIDLEPTRGAFTGQQIMFTWAFKFSGVK
ncbi:MAG: hypothetical protein ACPGEG_04890 [Salibacteraceae bacterium]